MKKLILLFLLLPALAIAQSLPPNTVTTLPVWEAIIGKPSELDDISSALSSKVSTTDERLSDARTPTAHGHGAADITQDANNRFVTDTEKSAWTGKQDALGFTAVDTNDSRLSDARTPTAHNHTISNITDHVAPQNTTCSGTDKISAYNATTGALTCSTDQTGGGSITVAKVTGANITNSTTTPANITGLSWSVAANTEYGFMCVLSHLGTATSGPRFNLNGPASPTNVAIEYRRGTSATAQTISRFTAFSSSAQTAAVTTSGVTTVVQTEIIGTILNGANAGAAQLMLTSSTSGQTVTVYRGSFCSVY